MIVVTGIAGFIGSNVVKTLNAAGCTDIIGVDNHVDLDKADNLRHIRFADYMERHTSLDELEKIPDNKIDGIIHLGAQTSTHVFDPAEVFPTNFTYTKDIIALAMRKSWPIAYASSAAVYGEGKMGFRELPECEQPLNVYGLSKRMADDYVRKLLEPGQAPLPAPIVGLRYFNVYGPGENHKLHNGMASYAAQLMHAAKLQIIDEHANAKVGLFPESDKILRDFIYVQDVVDASLYLMNARVSGIFNVGTGVARSFQEVVDIIEEFTGCALTTSACLEPNPKTYQRYTCADISKLRAAGYVQPMIPLEKGLARYWVENNADLLT